QGGADGVPRVGPGGDLPRADSRDRPRTRLHRHATQSGHEEPPVPDRCREGRKDHGGPDRAQGRLRNGPEVSLDAAEATAARASHVVAGAKSAAARLSDRPFLAAIVAEAAASRGPGRTPGN